MAPICIKCRKPKERGHQCKGAPSRPAPKDFAAQVQAFQQTLPSGSVHITKVTGLPPGTVIAWPRP